MTAYAYSRQDDRRGRDALPESDGFAALSDPTRREIFELVAAEPRSVGALAQVLPVSRPAVSQHLKVLKAAGLVHDEAVGTRRVYHLDPTGVRALTAYLERFWSEALTAFKHAAESSPPENPPPPRQGARR